MVIACRPATLEFLGSREEVIALDTRFAMCTTEIDDREYASLLLLDFSVGDVYETRIHAASNISGAETGMLSA